MTADIVIIDDNAMMRQVLAALLNEAGHSVWPCDDGEAGLLAIRDRKPRLVLLDMTMPGLDGFAVLERLREDRSLCHIPVICVSALRDPRSIARMFELGAVDVAPKPIDTEPLLARIGVQLKLQEAERLRREKNEILEASPVVVFLWRNETDWPVENVSENVSRLFGYSASDFRDSRVLYADTVHPEDLGRVQGEVMSFSAELERSRFRHEPYRIVAADGSVRWVDDRTVIRRNEAGEITHYQGIILDISERIEAELALQESEAKFRMTGKIAKLGGWELDVERRMLIWSDEACRIYELAQGRELSIDESLSYFLPEDATQLQAALEEALTKGLPFERELRLSPPSGEALWIDMIGEPTLAEGKTVALHGTIQDVTKRKLIELELKRGACDLMLQGECEEAIKRSERG